ncbi:aspartate/glutamate racemase family protein [Pragia fontium]|uniref:Aspartate racemase n=2 Tax=Pragia fontium TaxID=82985 RepID=A0AAJ4WC68_9GAMM|nr:aspartate/glutamate racemase family protein [Pragia fontium]AKJ42619.1 aspartate racemase [Pragia fontium]SFD13610.1 aspartate racemase [Pragia fontium DSM 5563 = ATCC 49100]SUB82956.1 putative racemase [Pragia fontium]VEJ55856.1 putative racemase [Pragia fontium]GKX62541.1 racemase [Pragia fontium]
MKTIGLIGGMSWESTIPYYRHINETIKQKLGGLHSAKVVLYSVDFQEIEHLQHQGDWAAAGARLADAAQRLEAAGADFLIICTNTMHKVYDLIGASVSIPLCHIADATADVIKQDGIKTVGLLGTRFTMEQDFYKGRLSENHGIKVIVPDEADREIVHRVIYQELCLGKIDAASRREFQRIMQKLASQGAEGIILGCTEIGLLVSAEDASVPLYDTAEIHAVQAAEISLKP